MPRIEQNGPINPSISSRVDVFTPNVNQAGLASDATSQLGQVAAHVGMQIADKVKKTEDSDYAFNSTVEDHLNTSQYAANDLMTKGPSGHADRVNEFITKIQDDRIAKAPSNESGRLYNEKTAGMFANFDLAAQENQIKGIAQKSRDDLQNQADTSAKTLLQVPNPTTFLSSQALFNDRVDASVQGGSIALADADKLKKQFGHLGAKSLLDGYLDYQGDKGLDEGYRQLKNPDVVKNISPEDLDHIQSQFRSRMEQRDQLRFGDAKNYIKDAIAQVKSGETADANGVAQAMGVLSRDKHVSPDEYKRIDQEFKGASVVGATMKDLTNWPRSSWSNILKEGSDKLDAMAGKDSTFGAKERLELQRSLMSAATKLSEEQQKDPTSYNIKYNSALKDLSSKRDASPQDNQAFLDQNQKLQEYSQLPQEKRQVDTKASVDRWATALRSVNTAPQQALVIEEIQSRYGKYARPFMEQMAKDHKDLAGLSVAAHFDDQGSREAIVQNVISQKDIEKSFQTQVPSYLRKVQTTELAKQMQDVNRAISAGNTDKTSLAFANSLSKQVDLESQKELARDPSRSASDVVKEAKAKIVDSQFDVVRGGRSFVFANKSSYGSSSKEDVQSFMNNSSDRSAFKALDVQVPPQFMVNYGPDQKERATSNFYSHLQDTHRWVRNNRADGVYLVLDDGVRTPVAMTNSKGSPIEVKFRDMNAASSALKSQKETDFSKAANAVKKNSFPFFGGF